MKQVDITLIIEGKELKLSITEEGIWYGKELNHLIDSAEITGIEHEDSREEICDDDTVILKIPFKRNKWRDEGEGKRSRRMFLRFNDCIATLKDDGKKIAELGGAFGAVYPINYNEDNDLDVYAMPKDIWNAYCDAMKINLKINDNENKS